MKSNHISKMERLRSINLRIGFAAAILFAIFAFNWTSERKAVPLFDEEEAYPTEVTLKPFTVNQPRHESLLKTTVLKPNDLIVEVPDLAFGLLPSTIPVDSSSNSDVEVGNIGPPPVTRPATKPPVPEEPENPSPIFVIVEEMPVFNGCDQEELSKKEKQECSSNKLLTYLYSKIRYPEIARQAGVEGTVYIKFVIEKDGSVSNATIVRDIGGGCGEEALRVVNSLPKWTPGKQRAVPVRVQFNLPVKYKLD
jgi:protein TonB